MEGKEIFEENGGEEFTAANRLYAHANVYEEFISKFAEAMEALKVGPGLEPGVQLGPMVNAQAVKDIDRLVQDATGKGAKVLTGGRPTAGVGARSCRRWPSAPAQAPDHVQIVGVVLDFFDLLLQFAATLP